nr:hypothetical protein B0A51_02592 [Rachicladosporium sp. CCFEE 5018]
MSFYDPDSSWSNPPRQQSWDQPPPPSRSGAESSLSQHSDSNAFASQFEEIDRATDNLLKSGKWLPGHMQPSMQPGRRESIPSPGRNSGFGQDPRMGGGSPSRQHSGSGDESGRPGSAGLQGYYAGQRFPPRQSEAEQMLQAKRRMAAQREKELRNYHQEQQYNRSAAGPKADRAMSPNTMNEQDRRDLIARQHRALYGESSTLYNADGSAARPASGDVRNQSPSQFDPSADDSAVQMPPRERAESAASPANAAVPGQQFAHINELAQARTSTSSPGASPPLPQGQKGAASSVAPIGTRPAQTPAAGLNKRSTTPLTPSSLSYGFSSTESAAPKDERSASAVASPPVSAADKNAIGGLGGGWGGDRGAWGKTGNAMGAQASVWG